MLTGARSQAMNHPRPRRLFAIVLGAALAGGGPALAQQPVVYPAKGQSAEQQKKDQGECHTWAVGQSGYDPAKPPQAAAPPPQGATGSGARVRGAAVGATAAAVTGGDKSDAAKAGAVVGASAQRSSNRQQARAQEQQVQQAQAGGQQAYAKGVAACMEGRGYTVK
jgi:hypothetical protein